MPANRCQSVRHRSSEEDAMVEIRTPSIEEISSKEKLDALQERLGYHFGKNVHLLRRAVEHSSSSPRKKNELSSETLEFLGDAVLYLVVTKRLFSDQPWQGEGVLTELRKNLIKNSTLVKVGDKLRLREGDILHVGKSVKEGNGVTDRMVADAVEAIIGAIYRSDNEKLGAAEDFVDKWFFRSGIKEEVIDETDWTSRLKVWCDKRGMDWPTEPPCELKEDGTWICKIAISDYDEQGEGRNKSAAKRQAAFKILQRIESLPERAGTGRAPPFK
jgi:ribonuclease-3